MKYVMKQKEQLEKPFKQFSVTLEFETKEEYVNFHDNVALHLLPSGTQQHDFFGDLWMIGHGNIVVASGKI